jgi:zinc/manganese transport system permease protein
MATVDADVARVQGIPVTPVELAFLAVAGVVAAETVQAVGALPLLGLLAAPAAAARHLTARPYAGLALSGGLALAAVGAGLGVTTAAPHLPPTFTIVSAATLIHATSAVVDTVRNRHRAPAARR